MLQQRRLSSLFCRRTRAPGFFVVAFLSTLLVSFDLSPVQAQAFFKESFEESNWLDVNKPNGWDWYTFPNNLTGRVNNVSRKGGWSFRSYLTRDESLSGQTHSEIKKDGLGYVGETRWWAFSFYVPSSYVSDNSWTILQQTKSKEDPDETLHRPQFEVKLVGESVVIENAYQLSNGALYVRELYRTPIGRGQWTDLVFQAKFATGYSTFSGFVNVWKNGNLVVRAAGPNTINDAAPLYFKVGVYKRVWANTAPKSIYFDCVRLGDANATLADMAP